MIHDGPAITWKSPEIQRLIIGESKMCDDSKSSHMTKQKLQNLGSLSQSNVESRPNVVLNFWILETYFLDFFTRRLCVTIGHNKLLYQGK